MMRMFLLLGVFVVAVSAKPNRGDIVRGGHHTAGKMLSERGFVTCIGDTDELGVVVQSIRRLRALANSDPVEVFHVSEGLNTDQSAQLSGLSKVYVVDLASRITKKEMAAVSGDIHKYRSMCRTMALLHTSFAKFTWFDPEVTFFKNPASLWSSPNLDRSGILFFYDRVAQPKEMAAKGQRSDLCTNVEQFAKTTTMRLQDGFRSRYRDLCGGRVTQVQSSGIIVYDQTKSGAQEALKMLKTIAIEYLVTGKMSDWSIADKELPWIAAEFAGQNVQQIFTSAGPPQTLITKEMETEDACSCSVQVDPENPLTLLFSVGYSFWTSSCSNADSVTSGKVLPPAKTKVCTTAWLKSHKSRKLNDMELTVLQSFKNIWM